MLTARKRGGMTGMVVYWDLAALVNGAADYLLLLSAARLAGRTVPRLRLLGAAAFGAAYAVLRLVLPCSPWLTAASFVGMALLAFRGTGRALKLGLLTLLLSDILGTDGDTVLRPIEDDVDRQLLTTAVSRLSEREREIITLRFGLGGREEKTQKEVADYLGISQSYISRLEKRIIARLKREILKMS